MRSPRESSNLSGNVSVFLIYFIGIIFLCNFVKLLYKQNGVALAEWLRRVPAKYMGFPRESSNLSGDGCEIFLFIFLLFNFCSKFITNI